ncbi:MAG: TonB-dependent receptor [Moraxellaceae bacterium]
MRHQKRCIRHPLTSAIVGAIAASSVASLAVATEEQVATLPTIDVVDFSGAQMDSSKYTRELQDTPRLITVLPDDLLQEQGTTTLKDALKNIPGISLQAGEGNPPGGDQLKIRGFNARDDINVNDSRDLGNYFRDPFYVEQIEVVKGPNSAYSGRGSAGGTVNFVTKKPVAQDSTRIEASIGSDSFHRTTLDTNKTLDENSAVRVNVMAHDADIAGRDIAHEQRHGIYAAYTWGFQGPTKLTADLLHMRIDDLPDAGLPVDRGAPGANSAGTGQVPKGLDYSNFYGHLDDYKKVDVDQFGLAVQHAFDSGLLLKNQLRLSRVANDSITSSPRIRNIVVNPNGDFQGSQVLGNTKPRDQVDEGINNQTDVMFSFNTGRLTHDMVFGTEVARYSYENRRRLDRNGPLTDLYNPLPRTGPVHTYDGTTYKLVTEELGVYLLDTIKLSEQWELNAGLRWDDVAATATRRGFDGVNGPTSNNTTHERQDDETSYTLGLVYKLTPKASLYAAHGNAYVMSANFDRNSVQLAGGSATEAIVGAGFDSPPEQVKAYELGAKWQVGKSLDLGAAIFRTDVEEGRFPGQDGSGTLAIPNAEYRIDGFELLAAGDISEKWKLYAGYTYLKSDILASPESGANEAYVVAQELGNTPKHSFNFFTTYDLTSQLTVGGGMQYVDEVTGGVDATPTGNVLTSIPSYTTYDLYGAYKFNKQTQLRLNVYNVTDKEHLTQLAEGGGQAIPGRARQAVLTLRHDF